MKCVGLDHRRHQEGSNSKETIKSLACGNMIYSILRVKHHRKDSTPSFVLSELTQEGFPMKGEVLNGIYLSYESRSKLGI